MNVALEETEEWAQGRLIAKYGDTFLRGNNGAYAAVAVTFKLTLQCSTSPRSRTSRGKLEVAEEQLFAVPVWRMRRSEA